MRRSGTAQADVTTEGSPVLVLSDEERERLAELLAEFLIEAIGGGAPAEDAR